jgi:hypothetical protein
VRALGVQTLMQLARTASATPRRLRSGAPEGTYACFVRRVQYWSGERAGEEEELDGDAWELDVITEQDLLWERKAGASLHGGMPIEIGFRPGGLDQLIARNRDLSFVLRIALRTEPERLPMAFQALGANIGLSGICYFQPRGS